ncbi:hypothetical protein C1645_737822 [Glomus cerebriforme]|uniref:Uncharacterized protein n=1 Tax=Glomus cerebriforme TaxID=658196 RepID=A0A397T2M5_9GLOM|nr:hypothetical protein C1645_737822 [Glomus cerebriforme]
MPIFSGKEDEDVNDWVRQFEVVFTASGKAAGTNGTRQAAYAATCLRGLEPVLEYQVRRTNPANLNNAIDIARKEKEAKGQTGQERNMEEILKEETNKYKKVNPIVKELQNKEVKNDEMDDLINRMKKMEAHVMRRNKMYDEYNEYENNEYDAYEMENEEYSEENDMYPAPPRRSERNKDKVMKDE